MDLSRKFLRFLWSCARWQVVGAVALSTLLSLTEGVSLAMVFPLIALLGGSSSSTQAGPRTVWLFHLLAFSHIPRSMWLTTLLLVVLVSVGLLAQLNAMLSALNLGLIMRVRASLAAEIFRSILHADWTFLTRRRSSDLTQYLTGELPRVDTLAASFTAIISNGMVTVLMLGLAFYLAPWLTLLVLAGFALLIPWQRRVGRAVFHAGRDMSGRVGEVFNSAMDRLQNIKVVKAYGSQDAELALFTSRYRSVTELLVANEWRAIGSARWFQLFGTALICGVILLGLGPMHLTVGTMLIFLFAFLRAAPRINTLQSKTNEILAQLPAYGNILDFMAECEANSERGDVTAPAPGLRREVALNSVVFAYSASSRVVLDGVSLALQAGKITAIAGLSGAGKSTVADLVMGLLLPQQGTVTSDGDEITRANARAWRRHVGYVSQDTLLFHDSIRSNLLWAKPDATEPELEAALKAASAEFVGTLPLGIDTVVGDRGMMLSHGQRQRIALARALLLKPALLILDEATNSLDLENEETILRTVQEGSGRMTTLLISHRPTAVSVADYVYVLEGGKVAMSGTWHEVQRLVEAQAAKLGAAG